MNDEPTSDALSRASAYLDGELDAPGIAAVEADPVVVAEVTRLRALQESIRDVAGPTSYARDMAVAAALAEFDTINQPAAPSVRGKPRPNYRRWMAVAAAVAGLAALGAVVTTAGGGGHEDQSAQLETATTELALDSNAPQRNGSAGGAPPVSALAAAAADQALATEAPAAVAEAGSLYSQEAAATTAASAMTASASAPAPFDATTPIPDEAELGRIGRQLLAEWRDGTRLAKSGTACDGSGTDVVVLSDALLIVNGASRPVLLAGNPTSDETFALDPASCVVVMSGI